MPRSSRVELVYFFADNRLGKDKQGLSVLRVFRLLYSTCNNKHRPLFDRSSSALTTLFAGQRFWSRQTEYHTIRSFGLFRVLELFYALNEFMCACKFTSVFRFRDEAKQNRMVITNEVK